MTVCQGEIVIWRGLEVRVSSTFPTNAGTYACLRDPVSGQSLGNYPVTELQPREPR